MNPGGSLEITFPGAYLVIREHSEGEGRQFPLISSRLWKLGRSEHCAIVINDTTISRAHAMIQCTDADEYYLIDMGSRNGSFVNERRVSTPVRLRSGDLISVGQASLLFQNPSEASRGTTPVPTGSAAVTQILFTNCLTSVLVVDIRAYTALSQGIDQSVLCQVMGSWFNAADRILQNYGCVGQKYIGDAVMGLWLHRAKGQEGFEILRILHALAEFQEATTGLTKRFDLPWEIRIGAGLNTGSAAVGNPGTHQVMDFTALGDTVNAAFRLESASKELGTDVVLGDQTFNYIRTLPACAERFHGCDVLLKGYAAPTKTWSTSFSELRGCLHTLDTNKNATAG